MQPPTADGRRPPNAGRKVTTRNRDALIAAARETYAEHGLDVPLSAIARRAGVGQGVLYRNFPDRASVTNAVLEDNVRQIERAAADADMGFVDILGVLTWHLTESAAFIDLMHLDIAIGRSTVRAHARTLAERVECALKQRLPEGHRLGSVSDLMLASAMVSGAVSGADRAERERRASAAWRLLGVDIGPVRPFHD
ncbi:TetR/AcrR family transcriptional regulator [Nocardia vermiculata]|uniref:TetR/AcrR family transcriptional regulator n=1 Tax=Nocardia vermiculata TaxID=257274 RepID=A0A846Y999_9NOCA|nr:TetR/AcrR family transcriptional regulator [Nocardia vermiculata]NKY54412.1 TetR/AcrR family transcriptional regulator [Nocardia vermiculata]